MITAEHSATCINNILDEYDLSKEDFWKNPEEFINRIEDIIIRTKIEASMQLC